MTIVLFLSFILLLYGYIYIFEVKRINFPRITLYFKNLPEEFNGFTIAVISDLHHGLLIHDREIHEIVKKVNDINADIIVGCGDYVRGKKTTKYLLKVWPILRNLKAKHGVYFVNGNHDHWADDELSLQLLEKSGFSIRHKLKYIEKGKDHIALAGTGDLWEDDLLIDETLKLDNNNSFRIVVTHNPDAAEDFHQEKVDLFICGHTHGGQVKIPIINYVPVVNTKHKKFDYGLRYNNKNESVFISKGIGWSVFPLRLSARPEVPILVLKRKDK